MSHPGPPFPGERLLAGLPVLAALLVIAAHVPELVKPPLVDQANFELAAREMADGRVLYRDILDVKPPLLFHVYRLLRLAGEGHGPVVVADLVLVLLAMVLAHQWLRPRMEPGERGLGILLWGILASFVHFGGDIALMQAETLTTVLVLTALVTAGLGRFHGPISGMLAGAGVFAKILPALPVLGVAMAATRRSRLPGWAAGALVGLLAVMVPGLFWLHATGALDGAVELVGYSVRKSTGMGSDPERVSPGLYAADLVVPVVLAMIGWVRGRRDEARRVLLCWTLLSVFMVAIQGRWASYHFVVLLPPLGLLAGRGVRVLLASRSTRLLAVAAILFLFARAVDTQIEVNTPAIEYLRGRIPREQLDRTILATWFYSAHELRQVAHRVRDLTRPDESICVFGIMPQIPLFAGRRFFGPYLYQYFLLAESPLSSGIPGLDERRRRFLERFDDAPPAVVIVPDAQRPGTYENARELRTFGDLVSRLTRDYRTERMGTLTLFVRRP